MIRSKSYPSIQILSNEDVLTFEQRLANLRHILTLRNQRKIADKTMFLLCTFTELLSSPTKKEIDKLAVLLNTLYDHDCDSSPVGILSNVLRPGAVHTRAVKDLISANLDYIFELRRKQKIIEDAFRGLIVLVQASISVTKAEIDEFGQTMDNLSINGSVIYPFYPPFPYNHEQRTLYQHLWEIEATEEWDWDTRTFGILCNKIQSGDINSVAGLDSAILDLRGSNDTKDNTRAEGYNRYEGPEYEGYEQQRILYQHLWNTEILYQHLSDTEASEQRGCWDTKTFKTFGLVCNKIQAGEIGSVAEVDAALLDLRGSKHTRDMRHTNHFYVRELYTRGKIDVDTCCYLHVFAKCSDTATLGDIDKYAEIMSGAPIHRRLYCPEDPPFPCNKEQRFLYCYLRLAVDSAEEEVDHQTFVRLCDMIQAEEITSMAEIDNEISK